MILELQKTIVYGPIGSRRLGRSLGLNLSPHEYKVCTFNCRYCHYGWSKYLVDDLEKFEADLPTPEQVGKALEEALRKSHEIDYITFSGNGEPSAHPQFDEIVDIVLDLRDRYVPDRKLAILSNSTMLGEERVRLALMKLDLRIMKLDCGNEAVFQRFNRPSEGIIFGRIVEHLKALPDIVIQTLLAGGPNGNASPQDVEDWKTRIGEICPLHVQLYTCDREPADPSLEKVPKETLLSIKEDVEKRFDVRVDIF
jgi:wyosine [tRNA(Phe)-imidazoG37] synthetase (radical SAM superfamily)